MLHKLRFIGSIVTTYILALGSIGALLYSSHLIGIAAQASHEPQPISRQTVSSAPKILSGKPTRITIPDSNIDLPINDGFYDKESKSWTLSDTHAQFATMSSPANDRRGTTFIYGHGTDEVFGKIGTNHPSVGTAANIHTNNGRVFTYKLSRVQDMTPTDTQILRNMSDGPPRLIVQTCTGIFSEWRTMFVFSFEQAS